LPVPPLDERQVPLEVQQQLLAPHDLALQAHVTEEAITVHGLPGVQLPFPGLPPVHVSAPTLRSGQLAGQLNSGLDSAVF
jgi:hypothetical protein